MRYHVVRSLAVVLCALIVLACGDNLDPPPVDADLTDGGPEDASEDCDGGTCGEPTCTDGEENGDETDVDCGGSCAPGRRCGDGLGCSVAGDCQSGVCTGDVCQAPSCGDGVRQGDEACDDGNQTNGDGCDDGAGGACRPTGCGNGVRSGSEECDDGNSTQGDGCDNNCTTTGCGNGVITSGEVCDDDDTDAGDGCSGTCQLEPGFTCSMTPSVCVAMCGDGVVVGAEMCDDAPPAENGDGCSIMCTQEPGYVCTGSPSVCTTSCGDGVRAGAEGCDDAPPAESGDGCNASCFVEPGWVCVGTPSLCFPICGDGRVVGMEACDDPAPAENGDGCSAMCTVESGYTCGGSPSTCAPICGDGVVKPGEMCDDAAPAEDGDGCSASCTVEAGWTCMGTMPSICATTCGDGIRAGSEECDDAPPAEDGDGCSAMCTVETGYACTGDLPSTCAPICGDGLVQPGEGCDDAPPAEDGDGCSTTCTVETGYVCTGEPSTCEITCGDGDVDPGELCDDGRNDDGDGCSAACAIEFGYTCSGAPSDCVTTCGDGLKAATEPCDDAAPAEDGDGCSATCTVEIGFTCVGDMPSVCTTTCGDGVRGGGEQCDDGCGPTTPGVCDADDDGDGCTQSCTLECGDGTLDRDIEQCDDGNRIAGDGCSPLCAFEVTCGPGETLVQLNSTDVPQTIVDNDPTGANSNAVVPLADQGAVRQVVVGIGRISHTYTGDVIVSLLSPDGRRRILAAKRGGSGDHYINTRFDDLAATAIADGSPPFSGSFRPEEAISSVSGFGSQNAAGTWQLRAADVAGGIAGTLDAWTLSLCVDPTARCSNGTPDPGEECDDGNTVDDDACNNQCGITDGCGDGNIDAGELCDDDNLIAGDGCSATCQLELACGPGETPVVITDSTPRPIVDNQAVNAYSVTVPTTGGVRRAMVMLTGITHPLATHLDIGIGSPAGVIRNLSDDNGGTGSNYTQTLFDDAASSAITAGTAPYTGRFRPEASLSTTRTVDLLNTRADGIWDLRITDDTAGTQGTLDAWTLALCVAPSGYCGNGTVETDEECDDGNTVDNDACSNLCAIADGCGDGNLDPGEQCDDNNATSGDGCSASCLLDIGCAPGQTPVVLEATSGAAIVDNVHGGTISAITVPTAGVVRKVIAGVSITHGYTGDVDIFLTSPFGVQRDLSSDNGSGGDNYARTLFSDTAPTAITSGSPPYSGTFRPEQTISDAAGFRDQSAAGEWVLRALDDAGGVAGVLDGWSLALCIDTSATHGCGNGYTEPDESCDDGNVTDGDGCSATCQIELACAAGQTPVIVRSTNPAQIIADNAPAGVSSAISVAATGTVHKAVVVVGAISHADDGDVDLSLISPASTTLDLSSDQSGANYASTMFDDGAATAITSGAAPYRGRFRPEAALSGVSSQTAAGVWTLRAVDDASSDGGLLGPWVLGLCVE